MKVKVKGYLTFKRSIGEQILEFTDQEAVTLRELLVRISLGHQPADSLFNGDTGTVDHRAVILVNGRHHSHLPDQLDTLLKDGDEVAVFPPLAGG